MSETNVKVVQYQWLNPKNQYLAAFVGIKKNMMKNKVDLFVKFLPQYLFFSQHYLFCKWCYGRLAFTRSTCTFV